MRGEKVYILMREYQSSFGRQYEPEIVDIYTNKNEAKFYADEKNKNNNRKYKYSVKTKVLK